MNTKTAAYTIIIVLVLGVTVSGIPLVQGLPSTMFCRATPAQVRRGEIVSVAGSLNPVQNNVEVVLVYEQPDNTLISRTVRTALDGSFKDSLQPSYVGVWKVNATWAGNSNYNGTSAASYFEVFFPSSMNVSTTTDHLTAGLDNDVNITITNNGEASVSSVIAVLQIPSPLVVRSNSYQWEFNLLENGSSVSIPLQIFAPVAIVGSTFPGMLQLAYRDIHGLNYSEAHPVNFIVVGLSRQVIYNRNVSPQPSSPGATVTITAEVLNKGNVDARYTNATIVPSPVIEMLDGSVNYIGDVAPNSPVQFGVTFKTGSSVQNGTYPITVVISYEDDQYVEHNLNFTVDIVVQGGQSNQGNPPVQNTLLDSLKEIGIPIIIIIAALAVILVFYRRRTAALRGKLAVAPLRE